MSSKKEIAEAYDLAAEEYSNEMLKELEGKNFDRLLLSWFATQIPKDEVILEVGSGPGQIAGYLSEHGAKCIGTDISTHMVELARRNFPEIVFEKQDFLDLTYEDNTFYGVVGFYAIVNYSLDSLSSIFTELKRVLKQNGLLMFSFHIFEDEEKTHVTNFFDHEACELTFYNFRVDNIKEIVLALDFEIIDILIRYPYEGVEFPSMRAYFVLRKHVL